MLTLAPNLGKQPPLPFLSRMLKRSFGRGPRGRAVRSSRLGAMLGMLALLLQSVVPLLHPAVAAPAGADTESYARYIAAFGDHGLLCLQQDGGPNSDGSPQKAPGQELPQCPICQALHATACFVPPDGILLPVPAGAALAQVAAFVDIPVLQWTALDGRPRGPPVVA